MSSTSYMLNFVFSKNSASVHNANCSLILRACKVETDVSQTLIEARDRGGLWKVSQKNAICIFGM